MKKLVCIVTIVLFITGCRGHSKHEDTMEDAEIQKQGEKGAAVLEELDETEKGFWSR